MKICENCVQPDTRPQIYFENNVCGACLWEEEKKNIDWEKRKNELNEIVIWAKTTTKSNYDCVIGVSGGKDSTKQAIIAKENLGLRCLLVNCEPEGITDLGKYNIENLKNQGFDILSIRPNPKVMKKLIKRDFYKYLNPIKITEYALWSSSYVVAEKFQIPLIIQGENPGLTLGISNSGLGKDENALKADQTPTLSSGWKEYLDVDGIKENDLYLFHYDRIKLEKMNTRAIWLQYFLKDWSSKENAEFSKKFGFRERSKDFRPEDTGSYVGYVGLDSDLQQVNQMLKCIKFGFGQCVDQACYDIRDNRISRNEAIELVKKYDGKCAERYIQKFCEYIEIDIEEFWNVANSFRGKMWIKDDTGDWKNEFISILEQN